MVPKRHIHLHDGNLCESSQGGCEGIHSNWVTVGLANSRCNFDQYHVRHDHRQCLYVDDIEELPTRRVASLSLVKSIDPHAGIHRIHDVTGASPTPLQLTSRTLGYP
jgi:hypothetical protein